MIMADYYPEVDTEVKKQLLNGVSFSLPTPIEISLAKKIKRLVPCAEMVKFLKNGADATTSCIKLARAWTKRDIIACCGYHGYHDWYIGSTENYFGVPREVRCLTETFAYNDIRSLNDIFLRHPNKVAAVILEPIQADGPQEDFLKDVKKLAHMNGSLLIFD